MEKVKNILKKNIISILKLSFVLLIIIFVVTTIAKEIKAVNFVETITLIRTFPSLSIILLLILGVIAVATMTLYDFIIIKYLKLDIKPLTIFNVSFLASTINNISGLGGLTGASIRAVFFKKSANSMDEIADYNLLLVPATAIGLSVMALVSLIKYKYIAHIIVEHNILLLALIAFFIYLLLYFFIDKIFYFFKKDSKDLKGSERFMVKVKLLLVSILEWIVAYILFASLIRRFNNSVSLFTIFGIFTLGSIAGIASMLPGGVGSFDLVALVGFQYYGLSSEHILAALILFRVFYYFIPLVIGIIFTLVVQFKNDSFKLLKMDKLKGFINQTSSITNLLLSILVFLSGVVLLTSALIPGITERIKIASKLMSFPTLQLSHQLSVCIGVLLIAISKDIRMKVNRAYNLTWWLLLFGAISTFLKGFDYEEAIFLGIVLILLRMSKESFFRKSLPFDWFWTIISSIFAFFGVIIYMKLSHVIFLDFIKAYHFRNLFAKGFSNFKPSGAITYGSFILFLVIWELTKERINIDKRYEEVDEERLAEFLSNNNGNYIAHLTYLKDKHIFWAKSNKVIIVFEKSHNMVVALGDPIGDKNHFGEAIIEFQKFIDEYGYKSAFYEASENLLSLYHQHGYYFFKLGETAIVDLDKFDITSSSSRDFRNVLSRFKRDGYSFELLDEKSIDGNLYETLNSISDEWLGDRNEMGFSLGFMDKEYLNRSKVGIIKKIETDEIIAFASIMPKYDKNKSISIDLMRFRKVVPSNTMSFLILNLILKYKEDGYEFLNLGMAPLSNVGDTQNAHFKEKIAHLVFTHGKNIYSFGGLRKYKEKFNPIWKGRYLAYEDLSVLPASLIEATILIHSKNNKK